MQQQRKRTKKYEFGLCCQFTTGGDECQQQH